MRTFMENLYELVLNPVKAFITTLTGTMLGYAPSVQASLQGGDISGINIAFQHTVWTLTSIVAILAIVSSIQKQVDRYKDRKKNRIKSIFDNIEDDDPMID